MSLTETAVREAPETSPSQAVDEEALFREARQLRRRRWAKRLLAASLAAGVVAVLVLLLTGSAHGSSHGVGVGAHNSPATTGPFVDLTVAGPLAVGPTGSLYVADVSRDRVLQRLSDGRFRVVAGDGQAGFSGDGGPATKARLSDISGLAFAPDGRLYIADGGRVRVIAANGTIETIAGNGHAASSPKIADGTSALEAALGSLHSITKTNRPLSIAFSPGGQLYIATGTQILRLTASGKLDAINPRITSGPFMGQPFVGFGPLAIADNGSIDVGGDVGGWSIWHISPSGVATEVAYARGSGGNYAQIQRGPNGAIYSENGPTIVRVDSHSDGLVSVYPFSQRLDGQYFSSTYFAFAPDGALYADDLAGDSGFAVHQQLREIAAHDRVSLLWQGPK